MKKPLKVLQVEDSERDATLLRRHLAQAGYELTVTRVELSETMHRALETDTWDVILCDYSMPHFNALQALSVVRELDVDIPLIIISGTIGEEAAVEAMQAGAHDYLMKDNLTRLGSAIERELEEARSRRARRDAEAALRRSEERYRRLVDTAFEGIWIADAKALITYANQRLADMLGYTVDEMIGRSCFEVLDHDSRVEMKVNWQRRLQGIKEQYDLRLLRKDGTAQWVILSMTPILGEQREVTGVLAMLTDITSRKIAEQQIRLQATALESAANAILISDHEGSIIWVNRAFTSMTGYAAAEVVGQNPRLFKSGREEPAIYVAMWESLLAGRVWQGELLNRRKDGTTYVEEQSITPVRNERGEITNYIAIKQDVTARKSSETETLRLNAEIASQQRRLNNIVANVPGVVFESWSEEDPAAHRVQFVSEYVRTMTGYSVEEWLATPNFWLSIVHPDDRELTGRLADEDYAAGTEARREFRWITKDGRVIWVEASTNAIKDDDGRIVGVRGVTVDITERKRAEREWRKSEGRYRDLVENALDIIYTQDLQGNYTSVNQAVEQIGGYTVAESLRMNLADTVAPEHLERAREMFGRKLAGEKVTAYELDILAKDGHRVSVEINTRIIREDGVAVGVQGIARDVTERKQLEEQLRQAQKMEAVGLLAGGIAHDFNNMLTVISGYSELALRSLQPEDPLRRKIEEIRKAGLSAAALTRQLLAFSRKQVLEPKVLDLNTIIVDLRKMLPRLIGEDVKLQTKLEAGLGNCLADPGQVEQVIMNLAINARDAMPAGGVLTIETHNVEFDRDDAERNISADSGSYIMLAVCDSGTGMDDATQSRIFEPFYTTKEVGKGTGLGLSTVYGIVKQSGGNILVESKLGQGTAFKIYLPRVDAAAHQFTRVTEIPELLSGTETILLIEDEEVLRQLATEVLKEYGYRVLAAPNGGSALLICEQHSGPIELLLTDVVMPEMGGREASTRLVKLRPAMKILFMSGYTDAAIVHHGVLDDDTNFIQKPFNATDLARKVREVLDEKK
jgi:two-component system cell cycle sensor histidine kinase/response regulator CckA